LFNQYSMEQLFAGIPFLMNYQKQGYCFISYTEWMIVVKLTDNTEVSNPRLLPSETLLDPNFSRYGGMEFYVVDIVNKFNLEHLEQLERGYMTTAYRVGEIARTKFERNPEDKIPLWGITFYKAYEPAYYDGLDNIAAYSGMLRTWHDNGALWYECHYVEGMRDGKFSEYCKFGQLRETINYRMGKLHGLFITHS
jgi:hypothetical protein